jgi:hypothetical protein
MDEPPFLDTDVARTAVLMTAENFAFFCAEAGVSQPGDFLTERFVALEFAEFGGDHLDRLARFISADYGRMCTELKTEILTASCRILSEVSTVAYFVNLASLLENGHPVERRLAEIRERYLLIRSLNPQAHVLFVCTRGMFQAQAPSSVKLQMEEILGRIAGDGAGQWSVRIGRHVEEGGGIDVDGVVSTIAAMVKLSSDLM